MESTPNSPNNNFPPLTDFASTTNDILLADGFDGAFMGVCRIFDRTIICYDYEKCVEILVERNIMEFDEAVEFFEYNVIGSWVGTGTPAFLFGSQVSDKVIKKLRVENSYGKGYESVDVVSMIADAHLEKHIEEESGDTPDE